MEKDCHRLDASTDDLRKTDNNKKDLTFFAERHEESGADTSHPSSRSSFTANACYISGVTATTPPLSDGEAFSFVLRRRSGRTGAVEVFGALHQGTDAAARRSRGSLSLAGLGGPALHSGTNAAWGAV